MAKENKVVKIKVRPNQIEVTPGTVAIDGDDTLCWKSEDGSRFEIEFDGESPFDQRAYGHAAAGTPRAHRRDAARKSYKYTVYEEGNRKNMKDPLVIIEDPT